MKFLEKVSFTCFAFDSAATFPTAIWDGDSGNRDSDDGIQAAPNAQDWGRVVAELRAAQTRVNTNAEGADDDAIDSVGAVTTLAGLSVVEKGNASIHKTILTLDGVVMASTDGAANGAQTSQALYTFPEGQIVILGAHQVFPLGLIIAGGTAGYTATADFGIGVGSAIAVAAFGLTTTECDICASADVDLTGLSSDAIESSINAALVPLDGSAAAIVAYLNTSTVDDADHDPVADTLTVSGTITIVWTVLGND